MLDAMFEATLEHSSSFNITWALEPPCAALDKFFPSWASSNHLLSILIDLNTPLNTGNVFFFFNFFFLRKILPKSFKSFLGKNQIQRMLIHILITFKIILKLNIL